MQEKLFIFTNANSSTLKVSSRTEEPSLYECCVGDKFGEDVESKWERKVKVLVIRLKQSNKYDDEANGCGFIAQERLITHIFVGKLNQASTQEKYQAYQKFLDQMHPSE